MNSDEKKLTTGQKKIFNRRKENPIEQVIDRVARTAHSKQVLDWRKDQFRRLGFSPARADFLADTNIDLGEVRKLQKNGCPLILIEEILLGTCFAGEDEHWYGKAADALVYEDTVSEDDGA